MIQKVFIAIAVILLATLWYVFRQSSYEPFVVSNLNTLLNQQLVPTNLTGETHSSLYKKTALNEDSLGTFWKRVSDPIANALFDDRNELLQMMSCISVPSNASIGEFFKTVDYYTEYFETTDANFANVKDTLIIPRVKALYEKTGKKIHGPLVLIVFQSPYYIMKDGVVAIRNGNIGSLDYNYQARFPLDNKKPIHYSFYLIAPLHKPDGLADLSRSKIDICGRLLWMKKFASRDNNCFIQLPGDTAQSPGGCQTLPAKESWQCYKTDTLNGIYRRNAVNDFECLTLDKRTCKNIRDEGECKELLLNYSTGLAVREDDKKEMLNQLLPLAEYQTTCMGLGSGSATDSTAVNYGIAYFINPNFTSLLGSFDELAIYPFDESRIGQCPRGGLAPLSVLDILRRDGELLIDSEVDIASIRSPNIPQKIDFAKDVVYTISYWVWLSDYQPPWRNIFLHGADDGDRAPAMFVHPGGGNLHVGQASTRTGNETINSKTKLNLNQWYHVALVANVNTLTLYVGGIKEDSLTLPTNNKFRWTSRSTPTNRMIYNAFPYNTFKSGNRIKQFRWFNRILTNDEMNNLRYLS